MRWKRKNIREDRLKKKKRDVPCEKDGKKG